MRLPISDAPVQFAEGLHFSTFHLDGFSLLIVILKGMCQYIRAKFRSVTKDGTKQ